MIFSAILIGIVVGAFLIIKLASGYRPDVSSGSFLPRGLLVATSLPDGAQLWVNGKLKSATDATIYLSPDTYDVEIKMDGFFTWKKSLTIKKELVSKADAYLFAAFPDLKVLTFTGATNPIISPDGQKIVYAVGNASAGKQGLWLLDLADRPLGLARTPRQIVSSTNLSQAFTQAKYKWSIDSKQLLISITISQPQTASPTKSKITTPAKMQIFLIDTDRLNTEANLTDITSSYNTIIDRWQKEEELQFQAQLAKVPPELLKAIEGKTKDLQFSLDETKILYTATASAQIPDNILPPLPAASTQLEERNIQPDKTYVYDLKEDRNFALPVPKETQIILTEEKPTGKKPADNLIPRISWFPTAKHLFLVQKDKISIMEYDGTNSVDVFTASFEDYFAFPFPAGNRILVLTSIGKDNPPNLYAVTVH